MNDFEAPGRRLIACRYPSVDVAKSSWERLSHYFAARKAGGPTETVILPGAHHSPHLEMPEATLAAIVPFVRLVLDWPDPFPRS